MKKLGLVMTQKQVEEVMAKFEGKKKGMYMSAYLIFPSSRSYGFKLKSICNTSYVSL